MTSFSFKNTLFKDFDFVIVIINWDRCFPSCNSLHIYEKIKEERKKRSTKLLKLLCWHLRLINEGRKIIIFNNF